MWLAHPRAKLHLDVAIPPDRQNVKTRFAPNITKYGRLLRGFSAVVLLVGSGFGFTVSVWLGLVLFAVGVFTLFEAVRGWCVLRACGIKTRL